MKIKMWVVALIVFVVIFGGIGITMLTGDWATETEKVPSKYVTGEFEGEYNPEDIRGSFTFGDVADSFGIELPVLFDAFGLPADTDATAVHTKDIEADYGDAEIGNGSVQVFVALYKGLPIALVDTYLPKRAVEIILEANPNLTQEQKDYMAEHQVDTDAAEPAETAQPDTSEDPSAEEETESEIKGGTTFQQVIDSGLTQEQIEEIIGGPMPAANMTIRDYCTENGLSFSEVKTELTDALTQEN